MKCLILMMTAGTSAPLVSTTLSPERKQSSTDESAAPRCARPEGGKKENKMKPIIIKTYPAPESKCELVRLQKDANDVVASLQRCSGLTKAYIVSEIIRQAAPYVEFKLQEVTFSYEPDTES